MRKTYPLSSYTFPRVGVEFDNAEGKPWLPLHHRNPFHGDFAVFVEGELELAPKVPVLIDGGSWKLIAASFVGEVILASPDVIPEGDLAFSGMALRGDFSPLGESRFHEGEVALLRECYPFWRLPIIGEYTRREPVQTPCGKLWFVSEISPIRALGGREEMLVLGARYVVLPNGEILYTDPAPAGAGFIVKRG